MHQEELVSSRICFKLFFNDNISAALHLAALHNQTKIVEYLLAQDVEFFPDLLGLTPLDYAKCGKNVAIISLLATKFPALNGNSD